jgi:large subunit ribosomal protein L9
MKVILKEEIVGLGKKGMLVEVKDGYARNYLIPRNLAFAVNEKNKREVEHYFRIMSYQKEKELRKFNKIFELLNEKIFTLSVKATEKGTLYEAVDNNIISKFLTEIEGKPIPSNFIKQEEPIKEVGSYKIWLVFNQEKKGYFWLYIFSE